MFEPIFELPDMPHIEFFWDWSKPYQPDMKAPVIAKQFADGTPFAWVDDACIPELWLRYNAFNQPHKFVVTDPHTGLETYQVEQLIEFAANVKEFSADVPATKG